MPRLWRGCSVGRSAILDSVWGFKENRLSSSDPRESPAEQKCRTADDQSRVVHLLSTPESTGRPGIHSLIHNRPTTAGLTSAAQGTNEVSSRPPVRAKSGEDSYWSSRAP